jgi:hypothetical protein
MEGIQPDRCNILEYAEVTYCEFEKVTKRAEHAFGHGSNWLCRLAETAFRELHEADIWPLALMVIESSVEAE